MKNFISQSGAVISAFLASLCCLGPLIIGLVGIGSAGAFTIFDAYRPYLFGAALLFLGYAFYQIYGRKRGNRRTRITLWVLTGITAILLAFPTLLGIYYQL